MNAYLWIKETKIEGTDDIDVELMASFGDTTEAGIKVAEDAGEGEMPPHLLEFMKNNEPSMVTELLPGTTPEEASKLIREATIAVKEKLVGLGGNLLNMSRSLKQ